MTEFERLLMENGLTLEQLTEQLQLSGLPLRAQYCILQAIEVANS